MKPFSCWACVEYRNGGTLLYRFQSDQEITIERVHRYLQRVEEFDEERDSVTLFFEIDDEIDLDDDFEADTDEDDSEPWLKLFYACSACGHEWDDEWSSEVDGECEKCGTLMTCLRSEEIPEEDT